MAHLRNARNQLFHMRNSTSNESTQSDLSPVILFLSTVFFYFFYQLAMQPSWVLGGEMWAEMATNYFPNANSPSYLQKLFSTDGGYIPAPQRLIAFIGNQLNLPAASIPYLYTWSAIISTGMMIGVFCLVQFRTLVKSDTLRFLTAISILMVADFETRTFINFTYFSAFFVAIVTALALVYDSEEVPWWAWFIPILMVSKPAVLAALPAMILVAMVSKSRFRWVTICATTLCIGQIAKIVVSHNLNAIVGANEIGFLSKSIVAIKYFFVLLGVYILGPNFQIGKFLLMLTGFIFFLAGCFVFMKKKIDSGALIFVGFSLLFFNVLLNSFVLSNDWNGGMTQLATVPIYRSIIVGFFGSFLVVVGFFATLTEVNILKSKLSYIDKIGPVIFYYLVFCSWLAVICRQYQRRA